MNEENQKYFNLILGTLLARQQAKLNLLQKIKLTYQTTVFLKILFTQSKDQSMKKLQVLCSGLLAMALCLFCCSTAFAQADAEGMIVEAGISIPLTSNAGVSVDVDGESMSGGGYTAAGVGVNLTFGYKWNHFGISINQDLAGQFVTDSAIVDSWELMDKKASYFLGGTYFMFDEYIAFNSNCMLQFGEGLGAMYGAKMDFKAFWVDSDAAFAIKLDIAFHYFIEERFGIGLKLDYVAALAIDNGIAFTHYFAPVISFKMVL